MLHTAFVLGKNHIRILPYTPKNLTMSHEKEDHIHHFCGFLVARVLTPPLGCVIRAFFWGSKLISRILGKKWRIKKQKKIVHPYPSKIDFGWYSDFSTFMLYCAFIFSGVYWYWVPRMDPVPNGSEPISTTLHWKGWS